MSKSNHNCPISVAVHLGSLAAAAVIPALYLPKKSKLVSAHLMNGALIAASDSNYCGVSLKKGSTVLAELDTRAAHENGLAANVAKALNVVDAESELDEGSSLTAEYTETGTIALTDAVLVITYYPL